MGKHEALKQRLLREYGAVLDEVLAKRAPDEEITLEEIEALALETRGKVGEQVTAALSEVMVWQEVVCADCGDKMQHKGVRTKQVVTMSGEVKLRSPYYYCPVCHTGFSPSA